MSELVSPETVDLTARIAALVKEKGWTYKEFADHATINRHTARQIVQAQGDRKLQNSTLKRCAEALGFSVHELSNLPLERLLARVRGQEPLPPPDDHLRRLYESATHPDLLGWLERNPDRARRFTPAEIDDVLAFQQNEALVASFGVDAFVMQIERRRDLVEKVLAIAGTEQLDFLEHFVDLLFDSIQPYRDRL
jgi:transcriptional regulator with XRE-family HTH domain